LNMPFANNNGSIAHIQKKIEFTKKKENSNLVIF